MVDRADPHDYPEVVHESQHDVVLTPFMVRVREAVSGGDSHATLIFRTSRPQSIAVAVWEWFGLRTKAEHVISEANSMLDPDGDHIILEDEYGTGHLGFTLRWRDRSVQVGVDQDSRHVGHVVADSADFTPAPGRQFHPEDEDFMEELAVSLLSLHRPDIKLNEENDE